MARMATTAPNRLTSIYEVRYFDGDVPNEEQGDLTRHQDVSIQHHYSTTQVDHFTHSSMMPTPSTSELFPTTLSMLNIEEAQTSQACQDVHNQYVTYQHRSESIQFTDEGQPSSIRGHGDRGHYVTRQG